MASRAHDTKNVVQFFRDLQALKRPRQWSPDLFARTAKGALHMRASLAALPKVTIQLSDQQAGTELGAYLRTKIIGVRTQRAVSLLQLPDVPADYLKGRYRERLRTNISKANSLSVKCAPIDAVAFQQLAGGSYVAGANIKYLDLLLAEPMTPAMEHWVGFDADAQPIAFARVQIDGQTAWLKCMVAISDDPRSVVRYKLSADIFMSLAERGIKYVIAGSVIDLADGLAHFQHLLGFRPTQVELLTAD